MIDQKIKFLEQIITDSINVLNRTDKELNLTVEMQHASSPANLMGSHVNFIIKNKFNTIFNSRSAHVLNSFSNAITEKEIVQFSLLEKTIHELVLNGIRYAYEKTVKGSDRFIAIEQGSNNFAPFFPNKLLSIDEINEYLEDYDISDIVEVCQVK